MRRELLSGEKKKREMVVEGKARGKSEGEENVRVAIRVTQNSNQFSTANARAARVERTNPFGHRASKYLPQ